MMDACEAYNAVRRSFPNARILMCFFHVKFNCKKNYRNYGLNNSDWKVVEEDIDSLHSCLNQEEFDQKSNLIVQKWKG